MRFEIGANPDISEKYQGDPWGVMTNTPNRREQEFVTEQMIARGQFQHWPKNWCVGFKHQCVPRFPFSYWQNPQPPKGARIVIFAGNLKIPDAIAGTSDRWYRRIGPAPWLAKAWSETP